MAAQSPRPTDSDGMTRRDLFRRSAAAGGSLVAIGAGSQAAPQFSPVGRVAADDLSTLAKGAASPAYAGYYLTREGAETFLGDSRDYSGYTGADALKKEIALGVTEMKSADERVMTGIENNISNSENVALAKGKAAIIKEMNAGNNEAAATNAHNSAVKDYYASIQENLLTHVDQQTKQIHHDFEQLKAHDDAALADVFYHGKDTTNSITDSPESLETYEVELLNGDTAEYSFFAGVNGANPDWDKNRSGDIDFLGFGIDPADEFGEYNFPVCFLDSGEVKTYIRSGKIPDSYEANRFTAAWGSILDAHDSVISELSGFVSDVYAEYDAGDIPTEDLVDPITASTELDQDYDNAAGQSAHAAMMGIPTTAEHSVTLKIEDTESDETVTLDCDLFTDRNPGILTDSASISSGVVTTETAPIDGKSYTLTTTDGESVDIAAADITDNGDGTWSYDASGDLSTPSTSVESLEASETGFNSGQRYDPRDWAEPFYIAYNDDSGSGQFDQIEAPFTIVEVTDSSGTEVENFEPESQNNQTADVTALEEEIAQLRDEQIRLQEEAEEQEDESLLGGAGGWVPDGGGDMWLGAAFLVAIIAVVASLVSDLGEEIL
ncbi:hypothetical protein [Natrinema sp. SYSU A 869]|uniref:hypothetical protein n=1 Tax=Natrinema sp. SYSU A 869 TaxID=2871694 RepID=UPI001CA4698D|nr:hypothetical protein [Natrinema sp. SYSU A 869]